MLLNALIYIESTMIIILDEVMIDSREGLIV